MRILIVSHLFPAAAQPTKGIFIRLQAESLSKAAECRVVSGTYDPAGAKPPADLSLSVEYPILPWGPLGVPSSMKLLRAAREYRKALEVFLDATRWKPDIIHGHYGFPDAVIAVGCGEKLGIPVVATLHGSDVNVQLHRPVFGGWMASKLRGAKRLIVVSDHMLESLKTTQSELLDRTEVVPNGYDPDLCPPEDTGTRRDFLFVGNLIPVKNVDILIQAYAKVAEKTTSNLVIVGGGEQEAALKGLAEGMGLSDRIVFRGTLPHHQAVDAIGQARTLILPSVREGLPTVVVEALACGTPVIASSVGGIPGLLSSESRGIMVSPGDVQALTDALLEADVREWDHATIMASPDILTWDEVADRLLAIYADVLEQADRVS